jgi:hypothetical protein
MTSLPQIFAAKRVGNFQGIYKTVNNDEHYYLARAQDIIDGHSSLANPYLYEHKDEQPLQFWIPDYLLAKPLALLKVDNIQHGYFFYDFLFVFILTILTYSIFYLLTKSIYISFLGSAFIHINLFFFWFNRTPSPQLTFIFWLLLFLFWLKFLEKPSNKHAALTGIFFGLLFHIYTYYWTFYVVFFALFVIINFILKNKIDYKKYLLIAVTAFVVAIPYFISMIKSLNLPYYTETLMRVGMVDTHFPTGRKIVMWGSIILILLFVSYKKKILEINNKSLLLLSGVLAAIVTTNHHVITGKNLQFASHYWMLSVFIFIFTLAYLANLWFKKIKSRKAKILLLTLVFIFIFSAPFNYLKAFSSGELMKYNKNDLRMQEYAPVFKWLNKNTEKDDVVFANTELSSLIPAYTSNNVYSISTAGLHFMTTEELQERFVINNYWDDMNEQYVVKYDFAIWGAYHQSLYDINLTKNKLRRVFGIEQKEYVKISQEDIDEFLKFAEEIKDKDFEEQLKKYKVDYFIWDKESDENWKTEELEFLQPIMEVNNLIIYKVVSDEIIL